MLASETAGRVLATLLLATHDEDPSTRLAAKRQEFTVGGALHPQHLPTARTPRCPRHGECLAIARRLLVGERDWGSGDARRQALVTRSTLRGFYHRWGLGRS